MNCHWFSKLHQMNSDEYEFQRVEESCSGWHGILFQNIDSGDKLMLAAFHQVMSYIGCHAPCCSDSGKFYKISNSTIGRTENGESWWWQDYHYNTNTRYRSNSASSFIFPLLKTNCRETEEIVLRMIFTALLGILDSVCLWQVRREANQRDFTVSFVLSW